MAADPVWVDNLLTTGRHLRTADLMTVMAGTSSLAARSGIRPGPAGLETSLAGSTISVSAGVAAVYMASQGVYRVGMRTAWSGTLTAAHATLPRIDLVYLRVWDHSVDAGGLTTADAVYLAGTASATPSAPAIPAGQIAMPLATITVPQVGGGSPSVSTAVRPVTVAPGGILPAQTSTPPSPYAGQAWHDGTDLKVWNGSSVDTYQKAVTTEWTTPSLGTGYTQGDNASNGNGNGPVRYRRITRNGTDFMEWDGGANRANGAQTSNLLAAVLAASFRPVNRASFVIARNATSITGTANSGSVVHSLKIDFNNDGTLGLVAAPAGDTETNWLSLKGIAYPLT